MEVLWEKGPCTVSEVQQGVGGESALAYSSVITTLRILETKGFVQHQKDGRAFTYEPLVGRGDARRSAVSQLLGRFFEGSPELLMTSLFEDQKIGAKELRRLQKLVDEAGGRKRQS
jgi:predicted transcriptional regulator